MIVRGFVEPISRELPMEYALELNRLVELQMEGSRADHHGTNSGNQHPRRGSVRSVREPGGHAVVRGPRSTLIRHRSAFAKPDRKQEDWRHTPIERIEEFFDVFEPSNETQVTVSMIDGCHLPKASRMPKARWGTPAQASSPSRTPCVRSRMEFRQTRWNTDHRR